MTNKIQTWLFDIQVKKKKKLHACKLTWAFVAWILCIALSTMCIIYVCNTTRIRYFEVEKHLNRDFFFNFKHSAKWQSAFSSVVVGPENERELAVFGKLNVDPHMENSAHAARLLKCVHGRTRNSIYGFIKRERSPFYNRLPMHVENGQWKMYNDKIGTKRPAINWTLRRSSETREICEKTSEEKYRSE